MLSTLSVGCWRTLLARPSYNCKMLMIHKAFNLVLTFSIICGGIRTRTETPLSTAITGSFQDYCLNTIRLIPPFDITRIATFESPSLMVSYAFTTLMFFPQFMTLRYKVQDKKESNLNSKPDATSYNLRLYVYSTSPLV